MAMNDITIVAVPKRWHIGNSLEHSVVLPHALGRLKAILQNNGFSCHTIDFAIDYVRQTFVKQTIFNELEEYFSQSMMMPCGSEHDLSEGAQMFFDALINDWADQVAKTDPEWLGVSIVLNEAITPAYQLCKKVKEKYPHIKIVLGGLTLFDYMDKEKGIRVPDRFLDDGLIDAFITGDAEESIIKFMNGEEGAGINNYEPEWNISLDRPYADYSDMNLSDYRLPTPWDLDKSLSARVIISKARGCPMKCTFCADTWWPDKFVTRDPNTIYDEIIHYVETYGVTKFFFSDLTLNAKPKQLQDLLERLKEYQRLSGVQFDMISLMTIMPKKVMPERIWELMKDVGFYSIGFGMESASEKIRKDMKKGSFTTNDIEHTIDMCIKYDIQPIILTMVGYPTETEEDFVETLKLFRKYMPKVESNSETASMFATSIFRIEDESSIGRDPESFGIRVLERKYNEAFMDVWESDICNSTIANERGIRVEQLFKYLGYKGAVEGVDYDQVDMVHIQTLIENDKNIIEEYSKELTVTKPTPHNIFKLDMEKIKLKQSELYNHELFKLNYLQDEEDLKSFMKTHVYAVWDFMSLVKYIQQQLTCVTVPWNPRRVPTKLIRFMNEIVLDEESDITPVEGEYMSHFDLYLTAMSEIGADVTEVLNFVNGINTEMDWNVPEHVEKFVRTTFGFIQSDKPHVVAAAFAFGRETVIPDMFKRVLQQLDISSVSAPYFHFYLERHIEVDGGSHGHYSIDLVEHLCDNDPLKIKEAEVAALEAIDARIELWTAVVSELS